MPSVRITADELQRRIGTRGVSFAFSRSGGPGGQNVNKISTKVALMFDVGGSTDLRVEEKDIILAAYPRRITREGLLQVVSSRHRTQAANREAAFQRLFELLAQALRPRRPRKATAVPRSARQRRLSDKKVLGERKRLRGRIERD